MNHTISILVRNEAGVLSRVAGLFSGRGFNIESLTVAPTTDTDFSRMTIVTTADNNVIEQIDKQLNRLIPVIKVTDLKIGEAIEKELIFIKVQPKDEERDQILSIASATNSKVIDVTDKTYTLLSVGDAKQVNALIELLKPIGIKELVRSGKVAISKGNQFNQIKNL